MAASCCTSKSTCIMFTANILLLIVGVIITAVAGVAATNGSELVSRIPEYSQVASRLVVLAAMASGIILLIVSLLGLLGAVCYEKCCGKIMLSVYSIFLLLVFVLFVAVAAALFVMASRFHAYRDDVGSTVSSQDWPEAEREIAKFANSTFVFCCPNGQVYNADACSYLSEAGVVTADTCKGTYQNFVDKLMSFMGKQATTIGIIAIVIAFVLLCVLIASCCLLWRRPKPVSPRSSKA